jgi:hypothetical protein
MVFNIIFCSYWGFTQWLQNHLLVCPFKKLTGFDCPGCGFQRSFIALMNGDLSQSLHYYPATIPLLITAIYTVADRHLNIPKKEYIRNSLYIFTGVIITGAYLVKLSGYMQLATYHL